MLKEHATAERLGIIIRPEDVRLRPQEDDSYRWSSLPNKAHLFSKQLSKLSAGTYAELIREVGNSFEATSVEVGHTGTFTSHITSLEHQRYSLEERVRQLQEQCDALRRSESSARQSAVKNEHKIRKAQHHIKKLCTDRQALQSRYRDLQGRYTAFQKQGTLAMHALKDLSQAWDVPIS